MDPLLVFARVLLSAVFLLAAGAKLLDPKGTRRAATELGFPEWLAATRAASLSPPWLLGAVGPTPFPSPRLFGCKTSHTVQDPSAASGRSGSVRRMTPKRR